MNPTDDSLEAIRQEIDVIDGALLDLLNRRAACSLRAGALKAAAKAPVFRPGREQALMEKLLAANAGPLPDDHLRAVYREIISSSRALQQTLRVSYLGPEGTFSHMAGVEFFGDALRFVPKDHFADIFLAVESQASDLGVVPLENSLHGAVGASIDLFARHEVFIQAEWFSRIRHSLMSRETSLAAVKVVYSHAQALGQCSEWLRKNLPGARQISLESTAAAAHKVLAEPGAAAVGHEALAPRLGLCVLAEHIEDNADNWTRFCAIGPAATEDRDANKTSVLFSLPDKPGSLAAVLQCLAAADINMSKLESRPKQLERWKYVFFADLDCNLTLPEHAGLVASLRGFCHSFRILGAYPKGRNAQ